MPRELSIPRTWLTWGANAYDIISTGAIIEDFDVAVVSMDTDPVKVLADQLFQEFPASDSIRHKAI